jgi:hypothetical protein
MQIDVDVMDIISDRSDNNEDPSNEKKGDATAKEKNSDATMDLKHFFSSVAPVPGSKKGRGQCKLCK